MNYKNNKGFTLIELLVVISIIGMMSSVILASVNTARDKARVAAAQKFSGYNSRTLSADAAGIWNFDEGSGSIAYDTSGNGNNATLNSNPTRVNTGSPIGSGSYIDFPAGINSYIGVPYKTSIDITKGTLTTWIKCTPPASASAVVVRVNSYNFYVMGTSGNLSVYNFPTSVYNNTNVKVCDNKWHHIALSFNNGVANGSNVYIDGQPKLNLTLSTPISGPGGNGIGIASAFYNSYWTGFVGSLDDVMLYTDVLASEKINEIYAKGLISHGLAVR